jgi:hypothetical protein
MANTKIANIMGPPGPTAVSANANNKATLGSDSLLLVQGTAAGVAATTHAQTVSGDDPQLTNARTPTAHEASHVTGSDQIPNASASTRGLLNQTSGNVTDYVGGDNACHALTLNGRSYYGTDVTNSGAYVVTVASDFALVSGEVVWVTPTNANTAASPTLNVNSTGAKAIVNRANIALSAKEIPANRTFGVVYDGTAWRVITPLQRVYYATSPANPTIECAGYDSVTAWLSYTTNTGAGITLAHLADGVPVWIRVQNATAATFNWWIGATDPAGTAVQTYWVFTNALTGIAATRIDSGGVISGLNVNMYFAAGGSIQGGIFHLK